jgi:hypothetical protein
MSSDIQELTNQPGWSYFTDRAVATIASYQKKILAGGIDSLEDYKKLTGWLEGAAFVLSIPERVAKETQSARENQPQ